MDKQLILELENAATIIMAAPNLVTNEQRRVAESIILNFRKTKSPYNMCKHLLETSSNDYVKFEAGEAIKCALIREWSYLNETDILQLRDYLMNYVCTKSLPSFVQERLLQVIAIMVKRASVDDFGLERRSILQDVENLIINSDTNKQILGCKVIINLMQEYAITIKSTDVGLPLEVHKKAKMQFEATDLKRIFRFCLTVLSEVAKNDPPFAPNVTSLLDHILRICETVLTWKRARLSARFVELETRLTLGISWAEIMLSPDLLPLMFQIYWKVRDLDELSNHAMTCLVQLASLNGGIFQNANELEYLALYMENFLKLITCVTIKSKESVGVANIVLNIRLSFVKDILRLPISLQVSYFDEITRLTCFFIEGSTLEESTPNGNYAVAFERMFEAWTLMIEEYKGQSDVFIQSAVQLFNTYLEFHLAPPEGQRPREVDEVEEDEDNDRIKFQDNLQAIGLFGRVALDHSLPMLIRLLEVRIVKLGSHLHSMTQQAMNYDDSVVLDNLFEDLHWLLLIAGHTLCMDSVGETPLIPSEIMMHSIDKCTKGDADLESTLKTMASVRNPGVNIDCLDKCDQAIRIFSDVLCLCTMEKQANENNLGAFMSPEVGCTLMWFLKRWCLSYLLPTETYYNEFSPTLIGALGKDTDGATFVTNFLLEKIQSNMFYCKDEAVLLRDTVDTFTEIVGVADKSEYIVKSEGLWNLIKLQATILPGVLPTNIRKELFKGFILAGSCLTRDSERDDFYKQILKPVEQRLKEILCQENLNRIYHQDHIKVELIDIVEKLIGISQGSKKPTIPLVFDFLSPILSELPVILGMYHNYQVIVQLILELFGQCAKNMLCHLDNFASKRLYESTYAMVQTYAKYNQNRFSADASDEEDSLEDISLLLSLLSHVLCKDWLDLGSLSTSEENPLKASDVAMYGLQYLMPLITIELLRYPKLSLQFYQFLVLMSDMYPEKVVAMNDDMLTKVMTLIELGITKFHADVVQVCLDFIETMATNVYQYQLTNSKLYQLLRPFLSLILDLTLTQQINSEHISSVSTCIFALHCIFPDQYQMLVQGLIQSQSDERVAERLAVEFNKLHWQRNVECNPTQKVQFMRQFDKFIANVHGFLLIK